MNIPLWYLKHKKIIRYYLICMMPTYTFAFSILYITLKLNWYISYIGASFIGGWMTKELYKKYPNLVKVGK